MGKGKKQITQNTNFGALIESVQLQNAAADEQMHIMDAQSFILTNISNNIVDMKEAIVAIKENMLGEHMKALEAERENGKHQRDQESWQGEVLKALKLKEKKPKAEGNNWALFGNLMAGIIAGGLAFVRNYIAGMQKFWMATAKALKLDGIILKALGYIKSGFTAIQDLANNVFGKILKFISGIWSSKIFSGVRSFFVSMVNTFKEITNLDGITKDVKKLMLSGKKAMDMVFGPNSVVSKFFGFFSQSGDGMVSSIQKMFKFFTPLKHFFIRLGAVIGKIFVPIKVLMSIWDAVTGAIEGWTKTEGSFLNKFVGALGGMLKNFLNSMFGGLLDLLKDGVAWIANFFGAEEFAKWLDGFSFQEMITKLVDKMVAFVNGIINWFGDLFTDPGKAMADLGSKIMDMATMATDLIKSILKMILPRKDPSGKWYDPSNLAAKAIPDAIYKFAGIDPGTGKDLEEKPKTDAAKISGQQSSDVSGAQQNLNQTQAEGQNAKAESDKATQGLLATTAANSGKPNIIQAGGGRGSSGVVPLTSRSTNWDPEDAMARGMNLAP